MRIFPVLEFISMDELASSNDVMENPTNGAKVAIFDIDHCLYTSMELKAHESKLKRDDFVRISLEKGNGSKEEIECIVNENIKQEKTFMELFCSQLGMTPLEYYSKYDVFDYGKFIKRDQELISLIESLGQKFRLFAMTNSSEVRAREILKILGLSNCFEKVFCAIIINQGHSEPVPLKLDSIDSPESESWTTFHAGPNANANILLVKPYPRVYEAVHRFIGAKSPKDVTFFDDSRKNVEASQSFGWNGILVRQYKDNTTRNNLIPVLEEFIRQLN